VADAVALDTIDRDGQEAAARLLPMETLLTSLPAVRLTELGEVRTRHGNVLGLTHIEKWEEPEGTALAPAAGAPVRYRVFARDGSLVAVAEARPEGLQPFIVL
jgi:hypothetical protein